MAFNPEERIIKLRGQDYLEVKWRLVWFREKHPEGGIATQIVSVNEETGLVLAKATITNKEGSILATGHGTARDDGKKVWSGKSIEKAETSAIGRALAVAGFGTQFSGDEISEDENGVDSPVSRQPTRSTPQPPVDNPVVQTAQANGGQVSKVEKPWKDAYKDFISDWVARDVPQESLLTILNIKRWGEWTGTRAEADALVTAWQAKQPIPA
jgi:hypothetical protein